MARIWTQAKCQTVAVCALMLRLVCDPFAMRLLHFPRKDNPLRLNSDGMWLQSRLKATNGAKHAKRWVEFSEIPRKKPRKKWPVRKTRCFDLLRYFNNNKSYQSARLEVVEQIKINCVEFVEKRRWLHSISVRLKKLQKEWKSADFIESGDFRSIQIVR